VNARFISAVVFAIAAIGAVTSFVLTTVAMDTLSDTVLVGGSSLVAFVLVAAVGGWHALVELRQRSRAALSLALVGGALAFWAAPLLALSQRASDAPSGADTLFFTTTLWGVLVVLGGYFISRERSALTAIAGAVCAAAGAAGLLASWEYPSSFSPFAKFPAREALMLVAGAVFAAGAISLAEAARRLGARSATTLGLGAAAVLGVLVSLPVLPASVSAGIDAWRPMVYLGFAVAAFAMSWVWTSAHAGVVRASAALFLAPPAMTAIAAIERATAVYGPSPFAFRGVLAGSAIACTGAAVVWLSDVDRNASRAVRGRVATAAVWVAAGAIALSTVSLGTPAIAALSEGNVGESFRAAWTMLGFESAAGWMPVAGALLALTAALEARRGEAARAWVVASAAVFACALAMPALSATTLHTWNRWIPAEVQQTYGTEYARLSMSAIVDPVRVVAMALAVTSAGVLGLSAVRGANVDGSQKEES